MLVARGPAIDALGAALERAKAHRGGIVLVRGEPGIGKSALLAEGGRRAEIAGFSVLHGRAWELGEAPPYFPLRPFLRDLGIEPPASGGDPFRLWEDVLAALAAAAVRQPLMWALEDLHAADLQSLDLLTYLGQPLATLRVLIVATTRATDPRITDRAAQRLTRIARDGIPIDLGPLAERDVATVAAQVAGRELTALEAKELTELTAGNPLFVVECARAFSAAGAAPRALPQTIRHVVAERVALLADETKRVLFAAAVLGREAAAATVARMTELLPARVIDALLPAVVAGFVSEIRPGSFAFGHIVVRDAIEDSLSASVRADLHARAESALEGDSVDVLVERARHALAAMRPDAVPLALEATARLEQLGAYDRALAMHQRIEAIRPSPPRQKLRIALIALTAGRFGVASELCTQVIAEARANKDAELLAEAALVLGAEVRPATVDAVLVDALREARALLGDSDGALACRVLARLAAALQPADDPEVPVAMARAAIAKARGTGDDSLLLDVLHVAIAAFVDYTTNAERTPMANELLERALRAGDLTKALRAQVLYATDLAEQGDLAAFESAVDAAFELSQRIGLPRHRWRPLFLDSMRALAQGDRETSDRRQVEVQQLAALTDDPALMLSLNAHALTAARLLHKDDELRAMLPNLEQSLGTVRHGRFITAALTAGIAARLEDRALTQRALEGARLEPFGFQIRSLAAHVAEASAFMGEEKLCRAMLDFWKTHATEHVIGGVIPFTYEGPSARILALLEAALGERASAERRLRETLAAVEARGHRAWVAQLHYDLGVLTGDATHLGRAVDLGEEIGMPGLVARGRARVGAPRPVLVAPSRLTIMREGDTWRVEHAGHLARVKDSRGVQMLARLIERPGEDIHVLVLASDDASASVHDGGAGPALDDRARRDYKARLDDLLAALAEAEAHHDAGRVAKLQAERAALESELRRAFGLGGRARPTANSPTERARVNVQRRLKDAIARIAEHLPTAGRFLEKAVVTGTYCRYLA